jgi:hypothetical protein
MEKKYSSENSPQAPLIISLDRNIGIRKEAEKEGEKNEKPGEKEERKEEMEKEEEKEKKKIKQMSLEKEKRVKLMERSMNLTSETIELFFFFCFTVNLSFF